jgi:pyruvate/2-oxoglutarate dehydrogenase complex dihydrolipoamide dehydrogenase (E3) component
MQKPEFDLCVIGGGSGGLVAAAGGATLGARVALIERRALGGDCLYYGCVPSKTLLHSAKVAHTIREAECFGIRSARSVADIPDVMSRVSEVIKSIEPHDSPERFRSLGVEVIFGSRKFLDPESFSVDGRKVTAKKFVLATGSRPAIPPIVGLDQVTYLTNETVFELKEPVPSLLVLGAGPIGVEMAQAFCRLGSRVHVIEASSRILDKDDPDLGDVVYRRLTQEGIEFHLGQTVERMERTEQQIRALVKGGNGREKWLEASHLLIATGRAANVEALGLEAAGVKVEKKKLVLDSRLRTSNKNIYACGDVAGSYQFTHMAEYQAGIVLRNALFHLPVKADSRAVPWCTFTDPELARVGLSQTEVEKQKIPHRIYTFSFEDIDRAHCTSETAGFVKVVTRPGGKLLGAAIVGPHAGELIHEYALALTKKMKISDLSSVIHIYPTLSQINRRVADERMKQKLTPMVKKLIGWIFGLRGLASAARQPVPAEGKRLSI